MVPRKLKRAVISEEYVAITGCYIDALVLSQFLYWSKRVRDVDELMQEENKRLEIHGLQQVDLQYGWIYKTAGQLKDELMLDIPIKSFRKAISRVVDLGLLHKRKNPKFKWDQTLQYRVDFEVLVNALKNKGYDLQGFAKLITVHVAYRELRECSGATAIPEITTEIKKNGGNGKEPTTEQFETLATLAAQKRKEDAEKANEAADRT